MTTSKESAIQEIDPEKSSDEIENVLKELGEMRKIEFDFLQCSKHLSNLSSFKSLEDLSTLSSSRDYLSVLFDRYSPQEREHASKLTAPVKNGILKNLKCLCLLLVYGKRNWRYSNTLKRCKHILMTP